MYSLLGLAAAALLTLVGRHQRARAGAVADQSGCRADGESRLRRTDDRSPRWWWTWRRWRWRRLHGGGWRLWRRWLPRRRCGISWAARRSTAARWSVSVAAFAGGGFRYGGHRFGPPAPLQWRFFVGGVLLRRLTRTTTIIPITIIPLLPRCRIVLTDYGPRRVCHYRPLAPSPLRRHHHHWHHRVYR